jgi:hypothetical protein
MYIIACRSKTRKGIYIQKRSDPIARQIVEDDKICQTDARLCRRRRVRGPDEVVHGGHRWMTAFAAVKRADVSCEGGHDEMKGHRSRARLDIEDRYDVRRATIG